MKWGRKKSPLASPSRSSSSSSIFRLSWLSKIKQTRKNFECKPSKTQRDIGCKDMQMPASWKNGRFYGGENNSDWRLSFRENYEEDKSKGCLQSVLYDSENKNQELSFLSRRSCQTDGVTGRDESLEFNQMLSNIKLLKELQGVIDGESKKLEGPKRKVEKELKLAKRNDGDLQEIMIDAEKQSKKAEEVNIELQEKDIFEMKPMKLTRDAKGGNHRKGGYSSNSNADTVEEKYMLKALNIEKERVNSEREKLKKMKMKELMAKSENQRKSVYISSELQRITTKQNNSKVRAYSPRTAYKIECKIKAIENMKRAKKKTEKMMKKKPTQQRSAFHNFAVVKSSSDPQSDFKSSMIEMITVEGIKTAEELEELLACYLTLNADQYHEIIIKVFRQVWFELILDHLAPGIQI